MLFTRISLTILSQRLKFSAQLLLTLSCLAIFVFASACTPGNTALKTSANKRAKTDAYWPTQQWRTSAPEDQDMDSTRLQEMMTLIDQNDLAYDSILVIRNGNLVMEEYRNGYNRDSKHHMQSATKSVSSMLIGIAIQEGFLDNVEQKVVDLLPGYTIDPTDTRKQELTLEHLLTMSDGLEWHELDFPYADPRNTLGQMWSSLDAVQHVLDQPMARQPGEVWAYNSGTSILLGGILEQATGHDPLTFAQEYLFSPLDITDVEWHKTTGNHYHTDGGLYLRPRDMARLGYLMLRSGSWNGKKILSEEWVRRSSQAHYTTESGKGYGYQWWILENGIFVAHGHHEQLIYVVPQADLVAVFTSEIPNDMLAPTDGLLYRYILAACKDLPDREAYHTYMGEGFTFRYPAGFLVQEAPFPLAGMTGDPPVMAQFRFDSLPFELVQILSAKTTHEIEDSLDWVKLNQTIFQQAGIQYRPGQSWQGTKDGQPAGYQQFELEVQGIQLKGITGLWICPSSERSINFSYATRPEVADPELKTRFQEHLDYFTCQ
jgi:CubicO group peptidase (beta-lactamase class C family)